jgi:hypothetical protein
MLDQCIQSVQTQVFTSSRASASRTILVTCPPAAARTMSASITEGGSCSREGIGTSELEFIDHHLVKTSKSSLRRGANLRRKLGEGSTGAGGPLPLSLRALKAAASLMLPLDARPKQPILALVVQPRPPSSPANQLGLSETAISSAALDSALAKLPKRKRR